MPRPSPQTSSKTSTLTLREKHPELFFPPSNIDPKTRTRTTPMVLLNLSFPRTGSVSLQSALSTLGIHCYHPLVAFFSNIPDTYIWRSILEAKFSPSPLISSAAFPPTRRTFDMILGSYNAVADMPAICCAEELIAAYPEAKVLLVNREVENWYRSYSSAVISNLWNRTINIVASLDPWFLGPIWKLHFAWANLWMKVYSEDEMRRKAKDAYREHYDLVRKVCPKERLLEYDLKDGWGPLCEFLGRKIPDVEFPRVNESEAFQEKMKLMTQMAALGVLKKVGTYILPVAVVVIGVWRFYT